MAEAVDTGGSTANTFVRGRWEALFLRIQFLGFPEVGVLLWFLLFCLILEICLHPFVFLEPCQSRAFGALKPGELVEESWSAATISLTPFQREGTRCSDRD